MPHMKIAVIVNLMEGKEDFIASKYANKLERVYNIDTKKVKPALEIVNLLRQTDPSGKSLEWVVKCYIKNNFKIEEDMEQVKQDLIKFNQVKNNLDQKDINSYQSLQELRIVLNSTSTVIKGVIDKQYDEFVRQGQCAVELQSGKVRIYKFVEGSDNALAKMSEGTAWCTNTTSTGRKYLKQGPVYQMLVGSDRYQLHFESKQFMDRNDFTIKFGTFDDNTSDVLKKWMLQSRLIRDEKLLPMFCWNEAQILHVMNLALNNEDQFDDMIGNYIDPNEGDFEGKEICDWWLLAACTHGGKYKRFAMRNLDKIKAKLQSTLDIQYPDGWNNSQWFSPCFPEFNITSSSVDIFSKNPSMLVNVMELKSKSPTTIINLLASLNESEDINHVVADKCFRSLLTTCINSKSLKEQIKNNNDLLNIMKKYDSKYYCPRLVCLMFFLGKTPSEANKESFVVQIEKGFDDEDQWKFSNDECQEMLDAGIIYMCSSCAHIGLSEPGSWVKVDPHTQSVSTTGLKYCMSCANSFKLHK